MSLSVVVMGASGRMGTTIANLAKEQGMTLAAVLERPDKLDRPAGRRPKGQPGLREGSYRNVLLTNLQLIFERRTETERVLVAVNADSQPYTAHFDAGCGLAWDLISGQQHDFGGGSSCPRTARFSGRWSGKIKKCPPAMAEGHFCVFLRVWELSAPHWKTARPGTGETAGGRSPFP